MERELKTEFVGARITAKLRAALVASAKRRGVPLNQAIEAALTQFCNRKGKK